MRADGQQVLEKGPSCRGLFAERVMAGSLSVSVRRTGRDIYQKCHWLPFSLKLSNYTRRGPPLTSAEPELYAAVGVNRLKMIELWLLHGLRVTAPSLYFFFANCAG